MNDKELLKQAHTRYKDCLEAWNELRLKHSEIFKFISGDQWPYTVRAKFENNGYTAITSNRLPTFLRQITNEIRKNTPEININPRSSEDTDTEKAEIINDLIRNIQDESDATVAYCTAAENAASVGIGYIKVSTKYASLDSMDQEIIIEPIIDNTLVMIDPNSKALDGSDMEYAFITSEISAEEYCRKYEKTKYAKFIKGELSNDDLRQIDWHTSTKAKHKLNKDNITIIEYYYKDYELRKLKQIRNLSTNEISITYNKVNNELFETLQERDIAVPVVKWCKLNEIEVLEETIVPGEYIPIVVVKGNEYWVDGKRVIVGAVEPAIETQMQLNYALSFRSQLLQMAPKAPYIGTADQFKNYEQQWADINISNQAFLPYNPDPNAPPPSRDLGELPINTANAMIAQAEKDLNAIFGTFDPSNQAVAPESGKAILARQSQSYNSNYHFYDNLARSIQHVGRIILEAIPIVYDTARNIQLLSQDKKKKTVSINQPNEYGVIEYDLTQGKYTVSIQTGESFGTKRQETVNSIMSLISVYPQAANAIADIAVRSMDWPSASKIADSLEALVPPQVLAARKVDKKDISALVPQLQSQVQQLTQQNQTLTEQVQQATKSLQESADKVQIEHMKAGIDMHKIDTDNQTKVAQLQFELQKLQLEYEIKNKEIALAKEELKLKEAQLGINIAMNQSKIIDKQHDKNVEMISISSPDNNINNSMQDDINDDINHTTGLNSALI